ncbi:hypothetical protein [Paenisporosarcina cavernae]|uniref:Uncharacterized protein n=1 Tax=Paenisporosarcina cavernae TaxID=2320858 RepID=A0A385YQ33_9BACL|nr:hypothetical protein [Paenisporosarcina cavernae]AYC28561.1 hypothetical protein D3873_01250 [Paenisporosarcina cavernae]
MEHEVQTIKINQPALILKAFAVGVPIIVFFKLLEYNLLLAIGATLLVALYEVWMIRMEVNKPFHFYQDRFDGTVNSIGIKMSYDEIESVEVTDKHFVIVTHDNKRTKKMKRNPRSEQLLQYLTMRVPEKIRAV